MRLMRRTRGEGGTQAHTKCGGGAQSSVVVDESLSIVISQRSIRVPSKRSGLGCPSPAGRVLEDLSAEPAGRVLEDLSAEPATAARASLSLLPLRRRRPPLLP